jgi:FkbM family methyltransferase
MALIEYGRRLCRRLDDARVRGIPSKKYVADRARTRMRLIRKMGKYALFYLSDPMNAFRSEKVAMTEEGLKFLCLNENLIERTILEQGMWERAETNAIKAHVQLGNVTCDIGANIGYFSLLMSKLVGPQGQVHCFEPTSYAFSRLQKNIELNEGLPVQNLRLNKQGLSDRCAHRVEALESRFSSRLLAHEDSEQIEFVTLDHYVSANKISHVNFVKIDVDGYDYAVIRGAGEVLSTHRPMVMAEVCSRVLRDRGADVHMYLDFYIQCGYATCQILETTEIVALPHFMKNPRIQSGSWNVLLT